MSRRAHPTDHEDLRGLCAAHALDALDPPESAQLEAHLQEGCEVCRAEIAAYRRTVGAMGSLIEERTPPAAAEARLMGRVSGRGTDRELPTAGRIAGVTFRWAVPVAALLVAGSAMWIAATSWREIDRLQRQLAAFETTTDPVVSIYDLEAEAHAAGARARATFDPRTGTWRLFVHDLLPPPAGLTYQGWLVTPDGPVDFGTFLPDETGHSFLALRLAGGSARNHVRVTLEPEGGSDGPTGALVFQYTAGIPRE